MLSDLDTYATAPDIERVRLREAATPGAATGTSPGTQAGCPSAGWGCGGRWSCRGPHSARRIPLRHLVLVCGLVLGMAVPAVAAAHPHQVVTPGGTQVIANGQNHGPFVNGVACGGEPAAYGLETAHHGPDAGTPGKADDCYQTTGSVPPGQDVENPVIR